MLDDHRGEDRFASVDLDPVRPFRGNIDVAMDRLDWTFGDTELAVNADFRLDGKHLFALSETVDRADGDTVRVPATNAGLANDMGHGSSMSRVATGPR